MTHLVKLWSDRQTVCGLSKDAAFDDGDGVSQDSTDCPACMPSHAEYLNGLAVGRADSAKRRRRLADRIGFLERKREATKADLILKFEDGDHHGVADAAMDLRDIESELKGLRWPE